MPRQITIDRALSTASGPTARRLFAITIREVLSGIAIRLGDSTGSTVSSAVLHSSAGRHPAVTERRRQDAGLWWRYSQPFPRKGFGGIVEHDATDVEMVQRHVSQDLVILARQHAIIAELHAKGRSTQSAKDLLVTFQEMQVEHEKHLKRLLAKG